MSPPKRGRGVQRPILSVGGARCSCRLEGNIWLKAGYWRHGRAVGAVRRSGKFGARLTRPGSTGFTAFIRLGNGSGGIARGETRTSANQADLCSAQGMDSVTAEQSDRGNPAPRMD